MVRGELRTKGRRLHGLRCALPGALAAGLFAPSVVADGLVVPPFRGTPGSTHQCWDFNSADYDEPDCAGWMWNPNGMPSAQGAGVVWMPDFDGRDGIICMPFGSSISFTVPNANNAMLKTILVQIIYKPHNLGTPPPNIDSNPPGVVTLINDAPAPGDANGWRVRIWMIEMFFCPPEETITLSNASIFQVDIDRVYIDTACGDAWPAPDPIDDKQAEEELSGGCPPFFFEEREACGADENGGCNSDPPAFKSIACGSLVCGTLYAEAGVSDTDWYLIDLPDLAGTGFADLAFSIAAEMPVSLRVVSGACASQTLWSQTLADTSAPAFHSMCLPAPGMYYLVVSPEELAGPIDDGFPCDNWYYLAVGDCPSCTPCPILNQPGAVFTAGYFSTEDCPPCPGGFQWLAERFVVHQPTTTGAASLWAGIVGGGAPDDLRLRVRIWTLDADGLPDALIEGECHVRVVQRTPTGQTVSGHAIDRYDLQLRFPVTLIPGEYAVEITEDGSGGQPFFIADGPLDPVGGLPGALAFGLDTGSGQNVWQIGSAISLAIVLQCDGAFPWCVGDLSPVGGDGCVNLDDLLFLLGEWGRTCSRADISGPGGMQDGIVSLDDLLALLGAWGPCPGGSCP